MFVEGARARGRASAAAARVHARRAETVPVRVLRPEQLGTLCPGVSVPGHGGNGPARRVCGTRPVAMAPVRAAGRAERVPLPVRGASSGAGWACDATRHARGRILSDASRCFAQLPTCASLSERSIGSLSNLKLGILRSPAGRSVAAGSAGHGNGSEPLMVLWTSTKLGHHDPPMLRLPVGSGHWQVATIRQRSMLRYRNQPMAGAVAHASGQAGNGSGHITLVTFDSS